MREIPICPYCGERHPKVDKANHIECYRAHRRDYYHNVLVPRRDAPRLPPPPAGYKRCTGCKRVLPLDQYYRDKFKGDGRMARCKDCERFRKEVQAQKITPEQRKARTLYMQAWRMANRDHLLAWQRDYQPRHRAERLAQGKHPFLDRTTPKRYGKWRSCKGCGEKKSIEQFRTMENGIYRSGYCVECERERVRRYQQENRDAIKSRRWARKLKRVLAKHNSIDETKLRKFRNLGD